MSSFVHRTILAALVATGALLAPACGGYKPPTLGACGDGTPLDDEDCADGHFVAADHCFTSKSAACGCVTCPVSRCTVSDDKPAEVSCGAPEP